MQALPSHLVRGAWIEIQLILYHRSNRASHLVRGAWIEIVLARALGDEKWSHLVRGAWIEISLLVRSMILSVVAPRKRCVD